MVLSDHSRIHRVTILAPDHPDGHLVAIVPDGCCALRLAALHRFVGKGVCASVGCLYPTAAQRRRLIQMLQILDCLHATERPKPALRQIAETVLYPGHDLGRAIEWKSSSQRRQTQRLVNGARHLMQEGYRELLKGRIPRSAETSIAGEISQQPSEQAIELGNL